MRTLIRTVINLGLLAAVLAFDGRLTTLKAYEHASRDARIVMLAVPAVAAFAVACILLHLIPSKARQAKRQPARRAVTPYAVTPAKRGR